MIQTTVLKWKKECTHIVHKISILTFCHDHMLPSSSHSGVGKFLKYVWVLLEIIPNKETEETDFIAC